VRPTRTGAPVTAKVFYLPRESRLVNTGRRRARGVLNSRIPGGLPHPCRAENEVQAANCRALSFGGSPSVAVGAGLTPVTTQSCDDPIHGFASLSPGEAPETPGLTQDGVPGAWVRATPTLRGRFGGRQEGWGHRLTDSDCNLSAAMVHSGAL
jgi:hypothetical protein